MSVHEWVVLVLGVVLQCMVLSAMLRGAYRRYSLLFGLVVFYFLTTSVQLAFRYYFGVNSDKFVRAYWVCDFLGTFLVLMVIIHLIRRAVETHKHRDAVYWGLLLGAVITAAISFLLLDQGPRSWNAWTWMTEVGRDYYFAAVLLNAVLWCMLVRVNHEDRQLYLITSGLGLQLSGAAIAHALRLSGKFVYLADSFLLWTYLASLYIWYYTFQKLPAAVPLGKESKEGRPAAAHPTSLDPPRY
ncbi:MAG: hypothetical protein HY236_01310 [Acidobacteria bacterium]|nr:hypothetical protein [Acidobacteriota bacterium]